MYTLVTPKRGWLRIVWNSQAQHVPAVAETLKTVEEIPGCYCYGGSVDLPHTATMLEPVQRLLRAAGFEDADVERPACTDLWTPRRPLYPYQHDAAHEIVSTFGYLLCDDMGLGKSAAAIVAAETIRQNKNGRPGVIVAPLFVRDVWKHELLAMGAIEDESELCELVGRNNQSDAWRTDGVSYYFVHYDVVGDWWPKFNSVPLFQQPAVTIVDEAHYAKNPRAKRSVGAKLAAHGAPRRIVLTGTPLDNKPQELWNLLTMASGPKTWGAYLDFRRRYAGATHNGYGWADGSPTNVGELKVRMSAMFTRRAARDVALQMPPLQRTSKLCPRDGLAAKHDSLLEGADPQALLRMIAEGAIEEVLPVMTRLRKYTSRVKIKHTLEYVKSVLDQQQKCVVFTWERETANKIAYSAKLEDRTFCITGATPPDARTAHIHTFQNNPRPQALVATYGALAEGVTLHASRIVVMHDLHWVLSTLLQAEKRIHRIGQRRACQSVWMIVEKSFDAILARALVDKARMNSTVLGATEGEEALTELGLDDLDRQAIAEQLEASLAAWDAS